MGLSDYHDEKSFDASSMAHFRKRLDETTLIEINEKIISFNTRPNTEYKEIRKAQVLFKTIKYNECLFDGNFSS
ncbi:hypothetical protein [Enterococcus sp. DIV0187]|uniref:hypothetical protein n=1 Tax=Enterococcus sp. DIV0187 TaxID=2774644 RepID=UPI003F68607D